MRGGFRECRRCGRKGKKEGRTQAKMYSVGNTIEKKKRIAKQKRSERMQGREGRRKGGRKAMPEETSFLLFQFFFQNSHFGGVFISKVWHCSESFILAIHKSGTFIGCTGASLPVHVDASFRHQHPKEEHPFHRKGKRDGCSGS